ncbi:MAG: PqqD family protein [Acidobacteriaceae bacterium]|nr:PqqD family protein [Acidobacteriaceae bacterium]
MQQQPLARTDRLITEELSGECVVYDGLRKKAHTLNSSLTWIWRRCDGQSSVEEMAAAFDREFDSDEGMKIVASGLKQLAACGLLEHDLHLPETSSASTGGLSRRSVVTAGSVLLPAVMSITVPTPSAAKSKPDNGNGKGGDGGNGNGHHKHRHDD